MLSSMLHWPPTHNHQRIAIYQTSYAQRYDARHPTHHPHLTGLNRTKAPQHPVGREPEDVEEDYNRTNVSARVF